MTGEGLFKP